MAEQWAARLYKSVQWQKLKQCLIAQRGMRCEECGRVVVVPSLLVGHHVQPLTPENVDDATIALNPDNIRLLCHDCHDRMHRRMRYAGSRARHVYLIYGAPCSGKSTRARQMMERGDLIVDRDLIYQAISGLAIYDKPDSIKANMLAAHDALIDSIMTRRGKWQQAFVIGGYPVKSERESLAMRLGAELVYCEATEAECLARAETRGKFVAELWRGYIRDWFRRYVP